MNRFGFIFAQSFITMVSSYSQFKAFKALTKAALKSIAKSPSSVVFTIAFPLVFILVFGFLRGDSEFKIKIAFTTDSDTLNPLYKEMRNLSAISLLSLPDSSAAVEAMERGDVTAIVDIKQKEITPIYEVRLQTNAADKEKGTQLVTIIKNIVLARDKIVQERSSALLKIEQTIIRNRRLSPIDFVLPGQLGFSLLAASVFGTAFVFFNLRQGLVLKRFFATPVRSEIVLLSQGVARMLFQLSGALFIILTGYFAFGFTLNNGAITVINMLLISALGLLVFMSFGFVISGLAKSESVIPPLSNIITLPQFLLAGTFFPVEDFPAWLQPVSKALPLTYLNDALRKVAFDGVGLWEVRADIGIMLLWGVIGYVAASRLFKWE